MQRDVDVAERFEMLNFRSQTSPTTFSLAKLSMCCFHTYPDVQSHQLDDVWEYARLTLDQSSASRCEMRSCLSSTAAIRDTIG